MVICILGWKHVLWGLSLLNIFYYAEKWNSNKKPHSLKKRKMMETMTSDIHSMYACVCLYVCVLHVYVCPHVFWGLRVHACICVHMHMCTGVHVCSSVCVHVCTACGWVFVHVYKCSNVQRTAPSHLSVRSHTCFLHRVSPWPKAQPGFCYLHVPSTEITSIHHEIPRRYQFHGDALLLEVKLRSSCLQGKHLTKPLPYRLILTSDGNSQLSVQIA
jgi:hypothetical protein